MVNDHFSLQSNGFQNDLGQVGRFCEFRNGFWMCGWKVVILLGNVWFLSETFCVAAVHLTVSGIAILMKSERFF